ncbi:MAG: TFIIB-type zinc ribbon-containing protein [Clostridiales bacterium]|nr:TFIIB-type zinc ribbon-containing protein [Clostridiales bacterium]
MSENKPFIGAVNVTSTEIKCPGCGGTIGVKFDPESLNLTCPFCGLVSALPQPGKVPVVQEIDFNSALQRASVNWGHVKKLIICSNCGGQTLYDAEQITGACPFCGSTSVTPAAENPQIMAPQSVIPFSISRDKAHQCFSDLMHRKHCLRKGVVDSKLENLVGIYIPFWTFDALTVSNFTAFYYVGKLKNYFSGIWNQNFDDLIVFASDKFHNPFTTKVLNYDYTKAVPYSPEYLAGIPAERYTVGLNEAWERSKDQMPNKIKKSILRKYGIYNFIDTLNTSYYNVKFRYLLVPMYFAIYRYKKNRFPVVINGQTGKTFCDAPTIVPFIVLPLVGLLLILVAFLIYYVMMQKGLR